MFLQVNAHHVLQIIFCLILQFLKLQLIYLMIETKQTKKYFGKYKQLKLPPKSQAKKFKIIPKVADDMVQKFIFIFTTLFNFTH